MLKFMLDSLDGLDEATAKLYRKTEGGKFQLAIDGLPKAEDVAGLKAKVDELLAEKKAEAKARKAAEDAAAAAAEEAARKGGDVTALERSWQDKLAKREGDLQKQIDALMGSITTMTVDNVATKLASELAVPGSADILVPHIRSRLAAEQRDGQFVTVVRDSAGKPSAASLDELKNEFTTNAAFAPVIVGSKATGGGATGSRNGSGGAARAITRTQFDAMSQAQRMEHSKAGGTVTE